MGHACPIISHSPTHNNAANLSSWKQAEEDQTHFDCGHWYWKETHAVWFYVVIGLWDHKISTGCLLHHWRGGLSNELFKLRLSPHFFSLRYTTLAKPHRSPLSCPAPYESSLKYRLSYDATMTTQQKSHCKILWDMLKPWKSLYKCVSLCKFSSQGKRMLCNLWWYPTLLSSSF